jgi:predicted flavoprotein YhiN
LNQITKKERIHLQEALKSLPLTLNGHLPMDKAMVTCGGVSKKEINPQTMESKLVGGLFFAGEIIAGCGGRGGYNLQQAFSTGYVAGNSASKI